MTAEHIALAVLIVILLAQQILWAKLCLNLINRLMSRNYYEFLQAQALTQPNALTTPVDSDSHIDLEDERQAQGANSLLGLI